MNKNPKKSQVAVEFIIFLVLAAFFFSGIIYFVALKSETNLSETRFDELEDLAKFIQHEIIITSTMSPDFQRSISLPNQIGFKDYNISLINNYLYVNQEENTIILPLPEVSGTITSKNLTIVVKNEGVYLS